MLFGLVAVALAGAPTGAIPGVSAVVPSAPSVVTDGVNAGWARALEDAIVAAPTWAARRERVTAELGRADGERAGRLGQALAVLASLERAGRADPSVVRLFVRAALADDATVRAAAVDAAGRNGDPPIVAVVGGSGGGASAGTVATTGAGSGGAGASAVSVATVPGAGATSGAVGSAATAANAKPNPAALTTIPGLAAVVPGAGTSGAGTSGTATGGTAGGATGAVGGPGSTGGSVAGVASEQVYGAAAGVAPTTPPTSASSVAPRPAPAIATLRAYKSRRLVREGRTETGMYASSYGQGAMYVGSYSRNVWAVTDGGGAALDTVGLARATGDRATLERVRRGDTVGWVVGGGLAIVGVGLLAAGAGQLDTGMLLASSVCLGGAVLPPVIAYQRHKVYVAYTPAEADRRIESYNAKLRGELGLTEEDVRDIDLQTRAGAGERPAAGPTLALAPWGVAGTF